MKQLICFLAICLIYQVDSIYAKDIKKSNDMHNVLSLVNKHTKQQITSYSEVTLKKSFGISSAEKIVKNTPQYAIVYTKGRWGIIDFTKRKAITDIKYEKLTFIERKLVEDFYALVYSFKNDGVNGILFVVECNGEILEISSN